ncbi:two-component response regulator ARR10-like [Cucumis melo]|uniref:Two-component response regulator ARR10-like n=1 Tax=Cucumis melo TaxID=3656 RepID=A0A1S3CC31_CUCME|nr:two-component response regulator ARR10-like [Cucumis melo]
MDLTKKWEACEVVVFRVLVVDHDSTSLKIVCKMLDLCRYEVVIANCAIDALRMVRERENEIHLVLTELHLPDMGSYEFLEKLVMDQKTLKKLPIVIMSDDDNEIAKLGCLFKGAMLHLVKPLTMKTIRNLWQFAIIEGIITPPPPNNDNILHNPVSVLVQRQQQKMIKITKQQPHRSKTGMKRPKLIWTQQLHNTFLHTIQALGLEKAHPKEILQHMNVPELRKENISNHLQKFRLSLKRDGDEDEEN